MNKHFIIFSVIIALFLGKVTATSPALLDTQGWIIDSISPGYVYYNFTGYNGFMRMNTIVNVIEIDLTRPEYRLVVYKPASRDSLSGACLRTGAFAGVNGTYELDASFIKSDGVVKNQVELSSDHIRFWKHEGAFFYNPTGETQIAYGTSESYLASPFENVISGAPVLIDNYSPVGETFVGNLSGIDVNKLDYEDYRRHQSVRHPRTCIAKLPDGRLLLITVDGRWSGRADGMSAKELTKFLVHYFNPQAALNIDGGGSTSMYIGDREYSPNHIVNYPSQGEDNTFDHYGQRDVTSHILLKRIDANSEITEGTGTYDDPYLVRTAAQLDGIRNYKFSTDITKKPYFRLENDIDLSGMNWVPINNAEPYCQLHFDGNGHVIKNMTVKNIAYGSLFGVICGTVKNLGVIDAYVESSGSGGIIAGYVGVKAPASATYTGTIENCFTTGYVSGTDAVGGIAGNIGKPNRGVYSAIKNCYSTATVVAKNSSGNSRAGGIVGIVFDQGILNNCYATGTITSKNFGAGGITGWSDTSIEGLVAINQKIINTNSGNIGRIAATMGAVGGVQAQGINCWGYEGVILDNAGTILTENNLRQGEVTVVNTPFDGVSKTRAFLSEPLNYFQTLAWDFASDNNVWAQTAYNGYPIFQWLANRADYALISGLKDDETSVIEANADDIKMLIYGRNLSITGTGIEHVMVFSSTGQLMHDTGATNNSSISFELIDAGVYIVVLKQENAIISKKVIIK